MGTIDRLFRELEWIVGKYLIWQTKDESLNIGLHVFFEHVLALALVGLCSVSA